MVWLSVKLSRRESLFEKSFKHAGNIRGPRHYLGSHWFSTRELVVAHCAAFSRSFSNDRPLQQSIFAAAHNLRSRTQTDHC
jgi:hypothetical protein